MTKEEAIKILGSIMLALKMSDTRVSIGDADEIYEAVKMGVRVLDRQTEYKTGKWEFMGDCWRCSACGRYVIDNQTSDDDGNGYDYRLCPACGADMEGDVPE